MTEQRYDDTGDFKEVSGNYTLPEAIREAQRCLLCKVAACQKGCPIGNKMPEWIAELAKGNFGNAMAIINTRSNLPAVCSRVCAHERQCEGHCVLGKKDSPIHVGKLERFVADFDSEAGITHELIPEKTRGRVAVIGSGPAGLTIAGDLSRKGFAVEIFEMEPEAGGMLQFGIPEYRLPKEVVRREIKKIENLGVHFHLNSTCGVDFTIDYLFDRGFDAIFMGTGIGVPKKLDIPGIEHPGVQQAIWFLRRVALYRNGNMAREELKIRKGDRVGVIGCGNTAMDAARTALRLGAGEVKILYHRTIDRMAALRSEYDDAVSEGVEFHWNASVTDIKGADDDKLKSVTVTYKHVGEAGETTYTNEEMPLDYLLLAVGSAPATRIVSTTKGISVDDYGYVITKENPYGMTTRKGVFAGGDVTNRPATVVHAMNDAKHVAEGIERYVDAIKLMASL